MVKYDLRGNAEDPVTYFVKTYTIYDAIKHVAEAWDSISTELIQKCYENVLDQKLFMSLQ